jgi:segregation and condensation protein A
LCDGLVERLEVIVRFLALLEIYKQGFIELGQGERFGDIEVVWTGGLDSSSAPAFAIDDYDG